MSKRPKQWLILSQVNFNLRVNFSLPVRESDGDGKSDLNPLSIVLPCKIVKLA